MTTLVPILCLLSLLPGSLSVQLDGKSFDEEGGAELVARVRRSGADAVQLVATDFFSTGEKRTADLERLKERISLLQKEGYPVTVWTSSLGYGTMTNPDFLKRFPSYQPLVSFGGRKSATCATDAKCRAAVAENVRDFIRSGAREILFDDDLVQACRPGIGCVCDEHLRRTAQRLGRARVTAADVKAAFTGASNALRTAYLDVMGESLTDYCTAMRRAADEVDPSVNLGLCASVSHYDLDGVDVERLVRTLAGRGCRPLLRVSGATYWATQKGNPRYWEQGLGGIVEFVRWQIARFRGSDIALLDENDTYPRDIAVVPPGLSEAYDCAMIAEGGIVRNKYILRRNGVRGRNIDPDYLLAHETNAALRAQIAEAFRGATAYGFRAFQPEHVLRAATLPAKYPGDKAMLRFFTQPMAGIYLASQGVPVHYERDDTPVIAFGPAAAQLPDKLQKNGVALDAEGARILRLRGVDLGVETRRFGEWRLLENAAGRRFAVTERTWYEIDCTVTSTAPTFPAADIWRFFTGRDLAVSLSGACGVYLLAKVRADGMPVALIENGAGETRTVAVRLAGEERVHNLAPWEAVVCIAGKVGHKNR